MPEPIMLPTTSRVASMNPSSLLSVVSFFMVGVLNYRYQQPIPEPGIAAGTPYQSLLSKFSCAKETVLTTAYKSSEEQVL
jgi:rubredoxin